MAAGAGGGPTGGTGGGQTGGSGAGGAGGNPAYDCSGVTQLRSCADAQVGLVCWLPGEALQWCVCGPAQGGPQWQCDATDVCPLGPGQTSTCDPTRVAALGGCRYAPHTVCSCPAGSGSAGSTWACNDAACPASPPTGACSASTAPGFTCAYQSGALPCTCEQTDGGSWRWRCNGQSTPDCPASFPGSGATCAAFQPGNVCNYPAGGFTGGLCTCVANGGAQTWSCPSG